MVLLCSATTCQGIFMTGSIHRRAKFIGALTSLAVVAGWGTASVAAEGAKAPDYEAIVASADRSDADRQTHHRRQPPKMLAFTGVKPGIKVLDMEGNAGFHTELLGHP